MQAVIFDGKGSIINWLDVAGPPGVGKSTLCDPLSPHRFAIDELKPPRSWHDFLNEVTRLMSTVSIDAGSKDYHRFVAAVRMNMRSMKKMAMVAREPEAKDGGRLGDGTYIQTGFVQRGCGFGWRLHWMGKDINEIRHFFRLMPVSVGVAILSAPTQTIIDRNRQRLTSPETSHENREFMVSLMEPCWDIVREEMTKRRVPIFEVDCADQDENQAREKLRRVARQVPHEIHDNLEEDISAPVWW